MGGVAPVCEQVGVFAGAREMDLDAAGGWHDDGVGAEHVGADRIDDETFCAGIDERSAGRKGIAGGASRRGDDDAVGW